MKPLQFLSLLIILNVPAATAQQILKLPSGTALAVAKTEEPQRQDGRKAIRALVAVQDAEQYDARERSIIADEFFGLYLGPYAEHKKYQITEIAVGNAPPDDESGSRGFQTLQTFVYERAANGVWTPHHDSLVDDEPLQKATKLTLPSGIVVHVEFQGTAYVNLLQGEAFVAAFWSDAPLADLPRVYPRAREYWQVVKNAIPDHISTGNIAAYDTPKLGHFHFREALVITLTRAADGSWPQLPESWSDAERARSGLIQASFREDRIRTIWPAR